MKELSIEQKAKAYNDIIERLKDFQFEYRFSPFSDVIGDKFPELKENKDERIRKDIISYIQLANQFIPQFQKDKWLSWLKKQGEQAKIEALRTEYEKGRADAIAELKQKPFDYSNANIQQKDFAMPPHSQRKSLQQVLNDFKNDFDYFVRYAENYIAEQKPAEEYNITGIGSKNAEGKLGEMIKNLKHDNEVLEQNHAWSEEDERVCSNIIRDIELQRGMCKYEVGKND